MSKVVHFEITAADPAGAAQFYHDALGWNFTGPPARVGNYWLADTGKGDAGIDGAVTRSDFHQRVVNTVEVDSLADTSRTIKHFGGRLVGGPNTIPGVGQHAYFKDPQGTIFGVLQPDRATAAAPAS